MRFGPGYINIARLKAQSSHPMSGMCGSPQLGSAIADKIMDEKLGPTEIEKLNSEMRTLTSLQQRIDQAAARLTGEDKARVDAKIAEARGYFNTYVLPAYMAVYNAAQSVKSGTESVWDSIKNWWDGLFSGAPQMGAAFLIPALPVGWVVATGIVALAGTASYYIKAQMEREQAILNDPAFTAAQKKELIEGGSLYGILGQAKWLIIAAGVGGVAYLYMKGKE